MYKRLLAALLSTAMFFSALPATRAEAPLYTYPEINVTLLPDDQAALEMEFREWAAELIYEYYVDSYRARDKELTYLKPNAEYYLLAQEKTKFDKENGKKISYNTMIDKDLEKKDAITVWILIESLKEAVLVNKDEIKKQVDNKWDPNRKYLMLNTSTGRLKPDEIVKATQDEAKAKMVGDLINATWDIADLAFSTNLSIKDLQTASSSESKFDVTALFDVLAESFDTWVENMVKIGQQKAEAIAHNVVLAELGNGLATQMYNLNIHTVTFLRESYSSGNLATYYGNEKMIRSFIDTIDPEKNADMITMIGEEAYAIANANANSYAFLKDVEIEYKDLIDVKTAVIIGLIAAVGSGFEKALEEYFDDAPDDWIVIGGKKTIKFSTIAEILSEGLMEGINKSIDNTINTILERADAGDPPDVEEAWTLFQDNIFSAIGSKTIWDSIAANLMEELGGVLTDAIAENGDIPEFKFLGDFFSALMDSKKGITYFMMQEYKKKELTAKDYVAFLGDLLTALTKIHLKNPRAQWGGASFEEYYKDALNDKAETEKRLEDLRSKQSNSSGTRKKIEAAEAQKRKIEDQINAQNVNGAFSVIVEIFDKAWETGISIAEVGDSAMANLNGESRLSLLAARTVCARNLSNPLQGDACSAIADLRISSNSLEDYRRVICDPERVPIEKLTHIVSLIRTQIKYDIVGSKSYYDISLHGWELDEYSTKYIYTMHGFITMPGAAFWNHCQQFYINSYLEKGILKTNVAQGRYDTIVRFHRKFDATWKTEWDVLFNRQ